MDDMRPFVLAEVQSLQAGQIASFSTSSHVSTQASRFRALSPANAPPRPWLRLRPRLRLRLYLSRRRCSSSRDAAPCDAEFFEDGARP